MKRPDLWKGEERDTCDCPACGVAVDLISSLACGHLTCTFCQTQHPDVCGACSPEPRWTKEQAVAWLLKVYYADWEMEHAALAPDPVKWLVSEWETSWRGGSGGHFGSYETRDYKVTVYDPIGLQRHCDALFADGPAEPPTLVLPLKKLAEMALKTLERVPVTVGVEQGRLL